MSAHLSRSGFWGKIPSRGDFVRANLSRAFTDAWDAWFSARLEASRAALGEAWRPAWMVAPVWRFCLRAGLCGPDAMLGLWMPSVDSSGRHYPLTLAVALNAAFEPDAVADSWLDGAEELGRAALSDLLSPDALAARLETQAIPACMALPDGSLWWKDGLAPLLLASMPDQGRFMDMLG